MKKVLLFLLFSAFSCVSIKPIVVEPLVFEMKGTKEEIFDKMLLWVAKTWTSPKTVIQFQDKSVGSIILIGRTSFHFMFDYPMEFRLAIDIKDNKTRLTVSNIKVLDGNERDITWQLDQGKIKLAMEKEVLDFMASMKNEKDSNW